mgnify:CR=1 FL=1
MTAPTLFEQLGGEPTLRLILDRFVDRLFDDAMIGFLFRDARRARVKEPASAFAARHLGAAVAYTGRPLRDLHARHSITGGQFNRRLQILKNTMDEIGVPGNVREHWIQHTEALRRQITGDAGTACDPTHLSVPLRHDRPGR